MSSPSCPLAGSACQAATAAVVLADSRTDSRARSSTSRTSLITTTSSSGRTGSVTVSVKGVTPHVRRLSHRGGSGESRLHRCNAL